MGIIRQLPQGLIEKIAAGEVVERPASVVKELVENAVDAGAASVIVDVKDGGKSRIAIADDGSGMDADDLGRSILRHATSKISDESDLWNIRTMGFRGEALAAIGAVSKLEIISRPNKPNVVEGARIELRGGEVNGPVAAGSAGGTKIVVSDLFFNVPARLKFLKSTAVEFGHINDVLASMSLAFPNVRFELMGDGKRRFAAIAGDVKDRIAEVLSERVRDLLLEVNEAGGGIAIRGFVAENGRAAGKDVHIFLNKRPVRDRLLMHALTAAFGERLARGQFPAAVLWVEVDPSKVDVNVHPTKREVRFENGGAVHDFVMHAVRKSLDARAGEVFAHAPCGKSGVEAAIMRYEQKRLDSGLETRDAGFERPGRGTRDSGLERLEFGQGFPSHESRVTSHEVFRPIGQLSSTYIICEGEGGALVLIDQHAAHEKLGFENLKRQYACGSVAVQRLLVPESVELGVKELAYVEEHLGLLDRAGFEVEPFGGNTLLVKAVPAILGDASTTPVFEELASDLENYGGSRTFDEEIERIFAVVACHAQVRAGDRLSNEEIAALVRDIERENIAHCPHGRPAVVKIEKSEIEKWFKRS